MKAIYYWFLISCSTFTFAGNFEQGLSFAKNKNWPQAQKHFALHLKAKPTDSKALYNMGLCFKHQEGYVGAIWHFEKAYKHDPTLQEAVVQLEYCQKKLNNLYTWQAPFSSFKIRILSLSMNAWVWVCFNISITLALLIFPYFVTKKYKKPILFCLVLGFGIFAFALYCTHQKAAISTSETHGIMLTTRESVYVDKVGNGLLQYAVRAGERVELVEKSKRIGVRFSNGLVAWVEPTQIRLY